jgi:MFS family permease
MLTTGDDCKHRFHSWWSRNQQGFRKFRRTGKGKLDRGLISVFSCTPNATGSVFSLINQREVNSRYSTFVLISGRLGEVDSHRSMLLLGMAWLTAWSLINGFCDNFIAFNVARAMSGIGGALIMPNAVAMIGITCPPGRMRNLSLGFFGASASIAGSLGSVSASAVLKFVHWKWIIFIL